MLKRFSDFYLRDKKARIRIYIATFVVGFSYAVVNDLLLKRPVRAIAYESLAVCAACVVLLPLAYVYRATNLESPTQATMRKWRERMAQYPPTTKSGRWISSKELTVLLKDMKQVAQLAEMTDDKESLIAALRTLGNAFYLASLSPSGKIEGLKEAIEAHKKSLALAEEIDDEMSQAHAHFNLGLALYDFGDKDLAKNHAEKAQLLYLEHKAPEVKLVLAQLLEWRVAEDRLGRPANA